PARGAVHRGDRARPGAEARVRGLARAAGALAFVAVTAFFGGIPGAVAGVVLAVAWFRGVPTRLFWIGGLAALAAAPLVVLAAGVPEVVSPNYGRHTIGAHVLVGVGLAAILMAALRELPALRRPGGDPAPPAGRWRSLPQVHLVD